MRDINKAMGATSILVYSRHIKTLSELVGGVSGEITLRRLMNMDIRMLLCRSIWEIGEQGHQVMIAKVLMDKPKKRVRISRELMNKLTLVAPGLSASSIVNVILLNIKSMPDVVQELQAVADKEINA